MQYFNSFFFLLVIGLIGCSKKEANPIPEVPLILTIQSSTINGQTAGNETLYGVNTQPIITISCNNAVDRTTVENAFSLTENSGTMISLNFTYKQGDSIIELKPASNLNFLAKYTLKVATSLRSKKNGILNQEYQFPFRTTFDSTDKMTRISDEALLDTIQRKTFYYFWELAHPVSGLARERNTSGDIVTSGGSGFGLMTLPIAVNRKFITRAQALERANKIVHFLSNNTQKFHGAFSHWINGTTGAVVPFSAKDNGADLVETSYLMAGLLTIRQFFDQSTPAELALRDQINVLWNAVEWNWFRKSNENVLYWHWSPNYGWDMNMQIKGWNECLITYVLAASSNTDSIPYIVYKNGFTNNTTFLNGGNYLNYTLPLGPAYGGPLFWSHYSFLGLNPNGLTDAFANYQTQVVNHTLINYQYSVANPKKYFGYSDACWGLTACDIPNGYSACEPNNDKGVIAPTAALSSFPYTPEKSMKALKFYYYTLGDKIWKEYGFMDSFSLSEQWYSNSALAIDQGPIMIMIENYRSQLIWNLFTSNPEIKRGLSQLGFKAPYL